MKAKGRGQRAKGKRKGKRKKEKGRDGEITGKMTNPGLQSGGTRV